MRTARMMSARVALILAISLFLFQFNTASASTYEVNGDDREFEYTFSGSLEAWGFDTFVVNGYRYMDVAINISCDGPLVLEVRNIYGPFVYLPVNGSEYGTSFHVDADDTYRIIVHGEGYVNYTIEIVSEYNPAGWTSVAGYLAYTICAVTAALVIGVSALVFGLYRAQKRSKRGISGDEPYRRE